VFEFTYLLTPWSRVLLEKLTGLQLVKKFPAFEFRRKNVAYFSFEKFFVRRFSPDKKQNTIFFHATTRQTTILRVKVSTCNGIPTFPKNVQQYTEDLLAGSTFTECTWAFHGNLKSQN
jgi:hypothetical protein